MTGKIGWARRSSGDAKAESLPKHPPIAHLVVGSYVAAGVFDLLSVVRAVFIPNHDVYQAATFLLILATLAGFRRPTGFRDRANCALVADLVENLPGHRTHVNINPAQQAAVVP